jgi:DeoR family transcriptional regulator, fructose operon transcriptional repressor
VTSVDYRHQFILEQIENRGSVNVIELADALKVSDMTVRRDLTELEKLGLVRRFHGGAVSARGRSYEPPLFTRSIAYTKEKELIGQYAAEMVVEGDSIALDVGSTVFHVALNLKEIHNITLITPSIPIAELFYDRADVRLIVPGGIVRPTEKSMVGEFARRNLEQLFVDRLFLGAGAIECEAGITEYNMDDALIKQTMIRKAKEVVLVADSSKFQKVTFAFVSPLNDLDHLITDAEPPPELLRSLKAGGVTVHIVKSYDVQIL